MNILGVHCGHDACAALLKDGEVVADVQEERFNRVKHSGDAPRAAVAYCLRAAGLEAGDLDVVACTGQRPHRDLPLLFGPPRTPELPAYFTRLHLDARTRTRQVDHHFCHAAAAFFTSGSHDPALVLCSDGVGDDASVSVWRGEGAGLTRLAVYGPQGSLGWFYSNVTEALGWMHGDGEGKTMALASGADPAPARDALRPFCPGYMQGELVRPRDFGPVHKVEFRGSSQWHLRDALSIQGLLSGFNREQLAGAAQDLLEEEHAGLAGHWLRATGLDRLCLGGGVFLNIILNRKLAGLVATGRTFIFPNPGDSGLALGAALATLAELAPGELPRRLESPYLGPEYGREELGRFLRDRKIAHQELDEAELCRAAAADLAEGRCVGWFQGRMECGPRALGCRSILMSPARAEYKDYVNLAVKFREPFRPFCPSLLAEDRGRYLVESDPGPYMILAFSAPQAVHGEIPAVVHVDGTIRPQVVEAAANPLYHRLLTEFRAASGHGVVLNTSFNVKGEPIVCTPADAVRCFFSTGMDTLALGNFLIRKTA